MTGDAGGTAALRVGAVSNLPPTAVSAEVREAEDGRAGGPRHEDPDRDPDEQHDDDDDGSDHGAQSARSPPAPPSHAHASISTRAFTGSSATPMADRAGRWSPKSST